jgi:hypothetical protein
MNWTYSKLQDKKTGAGKKTCSDRISLNLSAINLESSKLAGIGTLSSLRRSTMTASS